MGLKNKDTAYLAVYDLCGDNTKTIPVNGYKDVATVYPHGADVEIKISDGELFVKFARKNQAVFLRLTQ